MKTLATVLAAAAALTCAALPAQAATSPPSPNVPGVPVLGQAWVSSGADPRLGVLTVHGVRRLNGATALYYSMGLRVQDQTGKDAYFGAWGNGNNYVLNQNGASATPCTAAAIDVTSGLAYSGLRTDRSSCLSTSILDLDADADALGRAPVGWVLLAPVPRGVDRVDVFFGSWLVQDVPVEDGLLEPVVDDPAPAVGTGWPRVDTSRLPDVVDPEGAVFPLRSQVQDVTKKVTQANRKGSAELDLDASVLFATDKATLTGAANTVITEAAQQITAAGSSGAITVTGHTDSNAPDAYNLDLSERRAAAVAKALAPRIPGGIRVTAVGKGETDPIADNGSAQGRALNRRVTITLPQ